MLLYFNLSNTEYQMQTKILILTHELLGASVFGSCVIAIWST